MRKWFTLAYILLISTAQSQTILSDSRQTSEWQYLYRITNQEAFNINRKGIQSEKAEAYLHTLVDSFAFNTPIPPLPMGHYLQVYAQENALHLSLHTVQNCQIKIINNYRNLNILVHDSSGQIITNAQVKLRNKTLAFDAATQSYQLKRYRKQGLLQVQYNGVINFFPITNALKNKHTLWQKIKQSFPLKYFTKHKRTKQYRNYYVNYFREETAYQQKFHAYFVFSKPRYKPGDTLRFKAFITPKKGKPVNRPLLLRLTSRYFETDTILTTVQPYRAGGFEGAIVLNDSLDLELDNEYLLTLEELESRRYNLDEYKGDLEDNEYAMKRKILAKGKFELEEYELEQINFTARTDKTNHSPGNKVSIFAKATDENDLAVGDGRLQIIVLRKDVTACYVPQLFIPDTIWQHSQPLDVAGETKIPLPDSIFPKADFSYEIWVQFLNSNNEEQSKTLYQQYSYQPHQLLYKAKNDSLHITYQYYGKEAIKKATVTAFASNGKPVQQFALQLPGSIWLNPFMENYTIETDNATSTYRVPVKSAAINIYTSRTKDSVFINTSNPQQRYFWYTLLAGNRIIQKGYTNNINISRKTTTAKNYFLLLQYVWGGKVRSDDYYIPYYNKTLTIEVQQPSNVYPGQQSNIELLVKDAEGKPVADADVTAWAFTKKFQTAPSPIMPFTSKAYPSFTKKINYGFRSLYDTSGSVLLNWQRWSKEMGLDSIAYFQFLHPQPIYQSTEPDADSLTQLAPFVVKNGNLQPIHLLYIDERPVFFSQADQSQRYSFSVSPGKHALRLRTHNRMIRLDSIWVRPGVKNFISIEADVAHTAIQTTPMPDTLTLYEQGLWAKYMTVISNIYGENFATINQGNTLYLLSQKSYSPNAHRYNSPDDMLVGPIANNYTTIQVKNQFEKSFEIEPYYSFTIGKELVKQKSLPTKNIFNNYLNANKPLARFKDRVLTEWQVDSLWQDYLDNRGSNEQPYSNPFAVDGSQLEIYVDSLPNGSQPFVKSIFLFRYDNPDFIRIYKGTQRNLGDQDAGVYRLMLLLKQNQYVLYDSVTVKNDGYNYFATGKLLARKPDSISYKMNAIIDQWKSGYYNNSYINANSLKETFNERYFNVDMLTAKVSGRITDAKGTPIGGVTVKVKGLRSGVLTDAQGYFAINTPSIATLEFVAVGFEYQQKAINGNQSIAVVLIGNLNSLSEVVVTGLKNISKKSLTFSTSTVSFDNLLRGNTPGLLAITSSGQPGYVTIRGASSISGGSKPLYVIDGIPVEDLEGIPVDDIASIEVLKDAAATVLYGARGASGVIVITTKKPRKVLLDSIATITDQATSLPNALRRNFKDDGFWQPRLRTNQQGKAAFTVTFPDDITQWRTLYAAMTDKKQSGFTELAIRSFKPLSANLALPQFLVQGDSMNLIGKVLNYNDDTAQATRKFFVNNNLLQQQNISIINTKIDTFSLRAPMADSVTLKYTIEQAGGYFDGEERTVPIYVQGTKETAGLFAVLDKDTSFSIQPFAKGAAITLYAEASVLPVLLDEIEKLKNYEYLCNEQVASKLKALLLEKKIRQQLNQPFKEEKNMKALIAKLIQNRGRNYMWGWWANNDPTIWITLHVTEALLQAEAMGYPTGLTKQPIIDYIIHNQESFYRADKVRSLLLLHKLQAKADFKKYTDSIAAHNRLQTLYEKLQWMDVQQQLGLPVNTDSLLFWSSRTMFGNIYWGEENFHFFNNAIQNTLLAYAILRRQGGHDALLKKIRYYFLEKRKTGQWRNTYESALILETILPDLLAETGSANPPSFSISGTKNLTVNSFPFTMQATAADNITVTKQAGLPVYFTAYQQYHNPAPQKVDSDFEVTTAFEKNDQQIKQLKAGEAVQLITTVTVKADADYVMVEIPIPAGCSYKNKQQSSAYNEVHREYFKNKVSLFCTELKKGQYTFTVDLLPRYNGQYHLNPAKAELMYFPVFYGREAMKQVIIK